MKTRFASLVLVIILLCSIDSPAFAHDMGKPGQANKISAGTFYSGYIDENGSLWMWGRGQDGELGNGKSGSSYIQDTPVKILDNVVSISTCDGDDDGNMFTAAIQSDGSLWMWGANTYGQLGNGGGGNAIGGWSKSCQTTPSELPHG